MLTLVTSSVYTLTIKVTIQYLQVTFTFTVPPSPHDLRGPSSIGHNWHFCSKTTYCEDYALILGMHKQSLLCSDSLPLPDLHHRPCIYHSTNRV